MTNSVIGSPRGTRSAMRRQHILDTARYLFVERGFHQTGMAQIAHSSGIAVGQIYRDFANKEAIIATICEAGLAARLEEDALKTAIAAGDREGILAWIERTAIGEPSYEERRMMCEVLAEAGRNPVVTEIMHQATARLQSSLEAALASLAPRTTARDRSTTIQLIIVMLWGLVAGMDMFPSRDSQALRRHIAARLRREITDLDD